MKTREQIEAELRADNPTIDGAAAGDAHYEAILARWVDAAFAGQPPGPDAAGEAVRQSLLAEFGAEAPGVQLMFSHLLEPLRTMLQGGEIATAKAVIQTAPIIAELEPLRTRLLSHFP